jgi:glycosyltransferase involved in cell wall biosynthesis
VGGQPVDREARRRGVRILHVAATYHPAVRYGGTIVSVHGLCKALVARGHQVEVFTTSVDGDTDSAVSHDGPVDVDGVKVRYFKSPSLRRIYWSPSLRAALYSQVEGFDVVHTHAVYLWPLWAARAAPMCPMWFQREACSSATWSRSAVRS